MVESELDIPRLNVSQGNKISNHQKENLWHTENYGGDKFGEDLYLNHLGITLKQKKEIVSNKLRYEYS